MPVARIFGRGERLAYTAAAATLLVLWLLPLGTFDSLFGEMSMDFSIWVVGGLMVVIAATWLVTYNADVLLGLASRLAAPFASLRPVAKMAVAYPLKSRFRTGVTMSMFMLVVFTLVTGSTIPTAFIDSFDDVEQFGGGFDVRASTAPIVAVARPRGRAAQPTWPTTSSPPAPSPSCPSRRTRTAPAASSRAYPLRGVDDELPDTHHLRALGDGDRV